MSSDWDHQRLVVHRHGHEVAVDHRGVSIDGRRIVSDGGISPTEAVRPSEDPRTNPGFQVLPNGAVVYRGHVVAELAPGRVTVIEHGPEWPTKTPTPRRAAVERPYADQEMDL